MKSMRKMRMNVFFLFFLNGLSVYAQPMREGETPSAAYLRDQEKVERPAVPAVPAVPAEIPEREPRALPITPRPEPVSQRPPPVMNDKAVPVSRNAKASVGQRVEIPFNGSGWVYAGESGNRKGAEFSSRREDKEGQTFVFSVEKAGEYELLFSKQDFLRDRVFYDKVKIIAGTAPEASLSGLSLNRSSVIAEPRWPTAAQESDIIEGRSTTRDNSSLPAIAVAIPEETPSAGQSILPQIDAQTSKSSEPPISPDNFIQQAQTAFETGNITDVLYALDTLRDKYPEIFGDEAFWLYAQAYEANSPSKDIKTARYYYQRIVNEFPLSPHHSDARKRIGYIDRYYLNIQ